MRRVTFINIVCFFLLGLGFQVSSVGNSLEVDRLFTIEDGLSLSRINCIEQDNDGFLWIGTTDGLNKYDGYSFRVFRHQPTDTNSINDNYIFDIEVNHKGHVLIATRAGVHKYDKNLSHFVDLTKSIFKEAPYPVYDIEIDHFGFVWLKTNKALVRWNPDNKNVKWIEHRIDLFQSFPEGEFQTIHVNQEGEVWMGTEVGLYYYDRKRDVLRLFSFHNKNPYSISNNRISDILEDEQGRLWIGTKYGLNLFDREKERFYSFVKPSYEGNNINDLFLDHRGDLWIAHDDGISQFDQENKHFINYGKAMYRDRNDPLNEMSVFFEDLSHVLWIGGFQGLMRKNLKNKKFKNLNEFKGVAVSSLINVDEGGLFAGTWEGTLFNMNNQHIKKLADFDSRINALYYHEGLVLAGTDNGLSVLDYQSDQQVFNQDLLSLMNVLEGIPVLSFLEGPNNEIWLGSGSGLFSYQPGSSNIKHIEKLNVEGKDFSLNNIFDLVLDKKGFVWMATNAGLVKYYPDNGFFRVYEAQKGKAGNQALKSNTVYSLFDQDSLLWIGTSYGLYKMNKANHHFTLFDESDGLPNNAILAIQKEQDGPFLWLSTNKGLAWFDINKGSAISFDVRDGLSGYEFVRGSSCQTKGGHIYFGGVKGINFFHPDSISRNNFIPPVAITSIEVFDENERIVKELGVQERIVFSPGVKMFTINFAAFDFTYPDKNQYAYQMYRENMGAGDWINIGSHHSATFTNLNPGNYVFKVKGSNNDGLWNQQGATLSVYLKPPFWQTSVAYVLYVLFVVGGIFFIISYRTKKLRESNRILREKELASIEISRQKEELAVKNKDITDSINYAKRIQEAMMPSMRLFEKHFLDHFILYRPKSIVSGDFFWVSEYGDKLFVAAVDCTGHGVPGAFMSLIGIELFRRITNIKGIENPAQILDILNDNFSDMFSDVGDITIRDGMDIALCVIDKKNRMIGFAGAFNPLYLIRDEKIIEVRGDRASIGIREQDSEDSFSFTNHSLPLQKDDQIYIFSDGYPDQFGGINGKKYKKRRFRHLLLNIQHHSMKEQKERLERSFDEWKGDREQIDDVLVVGLKPDI